MLAIRRSLVAPSGVFVPLISYTTTMSIVSSSVQMEGKHLDRLSDIVP